MEGIKCTLDVTRDGVLIARRPVHIYNAEVSQVAPVIMLTVEEVQSVTFDLDAWERSEKRRRERENKKRAGVPG